eukprot:gene7760-10545_t
MSIQLFDKETQNLPHFIKYYHILDVISSYKFTNQSFDKCQVIVLEGLSGSGKSTLLNHLHDKMPQSIIINNEIIYDNLYLKTKELFDSLDIPLIQNAFDFCWNYIISYEIIIRIQENNDNINNTNNNIVNVPKLVFVEDFYHSYFTEKLCQYSSTTNDIITLKNNNIKLFEWPFDLPIPYT